MADKVEAKQRRKNSVDGEGAGLWMAKKSEVKMERMTDKAVNLRFKYMDKT